MNIVDVFQNFAADFEATIEDDDWSRLEKYFADDATYLNVGGPDPICNGRDAIIAFLKKDVAESDRCFDSRTLVALTPPKTAGNRLSRRWRATYTLSGAPDLVIDGEARYLFEGNLIKAIEEEINVEMMQRLDEWMQNHADKLHC